MENDLITDPLMAASLSPRSIETINLQDSKKTRPLSDQLSPHDLRQELYSKISPSGSSSSKKNKKEMMIDELFHEANLFNEANSATANNQNYPKTSEELDEINGFIQQSNLMGKIGTKGYNIYNDQTLPLKRVRMHNQRVMVSQILEI